MFTPPIAGGHNTQRRTFPAMGKMHRAARPSQVSVWLLFMMVQRRFKCQFKASPPPPFKLACASSHLPPPSPPATPISPPPTTPALPWAFGPQRQFLRRMQTPTMGIPRVSSEARIAPQTSSPSALRTFIDSFRSQNKRHQIPHTSIYISFLLWRPRGGIGRLPHHLSRHEYLNVNLSMCLEIGSANTCV